MSELRKIKRALISVSDKTGSVEFARGLADLGVSLISTGGTAKSLREAGIAVTDVAEVTGFPEMMDGRVKTLHPKIHGAFLALRDNAEHVESMREHSIEPIDMVVVNLYPFERTVARDGVTLEEAVENIDIGGPAMIRSASKNWRDVAVVTDPELYGGILDELEQNDASLTLHTRQRLAVLAYTRTASYDLAISSHLAKQLSDDDLEFLEPLNPMGNLVFIDSEELMNDQEASEDFRDIFDDELPGRLDIQLAKVADLRYGENPHQKAALYRAGETGGIATAEQLHGKEMSFNNYVDAEAAWNLVADFEERAVAIIKHTNPSGVGVGETNERAYRRALSTDPISAFGGIVAFNRPVDETVAASVNEVFTEVVIAPAYNAAALEFLKTKKNVRLLQIATDPSESERFEQQSQISYPKSEIVNLKSENQNLKSDNPSRQSDISDFQSEVSNPKSHIPARHTSTQIKQISGGFLVQDRDTYILVPGDLTVVSDKQPSEADIRSMMLAWKVCKHVKSNAIVFANETQTIGVGSGQMNRVDSLRIAAMRAERFGLPMQGAALASDAFFPFRDNVDEAAKLGITAIIQPGGSIKDEESIEAANEHGVVMIFTGIRHFNH